MKKQDKYYTMSCYKYAPESFNVAYNGKKIELSYDEITTCGAAYICGGFSKALAEVKRIMRQRNKKNNHYVTFGFYCKGENSKQYVYTKQLLATQYDTGYKLNIFKEWKNYIIKNDCKLESSTKATLTGDFKINTVQTKYDYVDINRPLKISITVA